MIRSAAVVLICVIAVAGIAAYLSARKPQARISWLLYTTSACVVTKPASRNRDCSFSMLSASSATETICLKRSCEAWCSAANDSMNCRRAHRKEENNESPT